MSKKLIIMAGILGGAGIFGYSLYSFYKKQVQLLKDFKWKIIGFNISSFEDNLVTGKIDIRFQSESDIEIVVKEFYLDVYINGSKVGYITDNKQNIIPARGYSDLSFDFSINPQFIMGNIVSIVALASKQSDLMIGLSGFIKLSSGFIGATVKVNCDCSAKNYECTCV